MIDPANRSATRATTAAAIVESGAVAVVRLRDSRALTSVAEALLRGGLPVIEVTLTTGGALDAISTLTQRFGASLLVGAGSVRGSVQAREALDAGARFLVSPVGDTDVLSVGHAHEVPVALGAFTPTEMARVHAAGADFVKLFPAEALGPAYVRSVLAPMPTLPIMPTGGVTPANVGEWLRAGCIAVGLGSALVDAASVAREDWYGIEARARMVSEAVAAHRATLPVPSAASPVSDRS